MQDRQGVRVAIRDLAHDFGGTPIIKPLSLSIDPGEFVSILGPSGCGKSTLLRLLAGLLDVQSGALTVEQNHGQSFLRSFVFQEAHLLPWKTVLQNVVLPLELTGQRSPQNLAKARNALERVGLQSALDLYPNQLSGGMKMRVSVARALVTGPDLLLLDEPFSALDETTRFQMQQDLRDIWLKERMTVVFVTHSVQEAVFLADRVLVFSKRPAQILQDHKIALPQKRDSELRLEAQFNEEMRCLERARANHANPN